MLVYINGRLKAENLDYKIEIIEPPSGWCLKCQRVTQTANKEEHCPKCSKELALTQRGKYKLQQVIPLKPIAEGAVVQLIDTIDMSYDLFFGLGLGGGPKTTKVVLVTDKKIKPGQPITGSFIDAPEKKEPQSADPT